MVTTVQNYQWGIVPYFQAWEYQKKLVQARINQPDLKDVLMLLQHPPVYTLGRGATTQYLNFKLDRTRQVYRIERGGEVTYHCPGQLVGYPILNLRHYQTDLHWYLRQLEATIIEALAQFGLKGDRAHGLTGVWVEGKKVAAIGISARRWITMHGFAINVCPDMSGFNDIVPCGIRDKPVGSLAEFLPDIKLESVTAAVATSFAKVFEVELVHSVNPDDFETSAAVSAPNRY